MFYTLLIATFAIALAVSWVTCRMFQNPADRILRRVIQDEIYVSWLTYLKFALYVVGVSSGVRIFQIERYISAPSYPEGAKILQLTGERWVLEIYRTVIESLQGLAVVLLVFFLAALAAFVIVRIVEAARGPRTPATAA
jgi:hypothetical protein